MAKELPNELWALVLGQFEDIRDFACLQRVSKTFYALALQNCWTKVRKIDIQQFITVGIKEWLPLDIDTRVPGQKLQLPIQDSDLHLEKLVEKAINTTSVHITFGWLPRHDAILCHFLDALVAAGLKVKMVKLGNLSQNVGFDPTALQALTRFLNANIKSITSLEVTNAIDNERLVPDHLREAIRGCSALENVDIWGAEPLVASILQGKPNLQSIIFYSEAPISTLLESGAMLRHLRCLPSTLEAYVAEVQRRDRSLDHPLLSLEKLELRIISTMSLVPWVMFPNLQCLVCKYLDIGHMLELVESFMGHWVGTGVSKSIEWHMLNMLWGVAMDRGDVAAWLVVACGCQPSLIQSGDNFNEDIFIFCKGLVSLKVLHTFVHMEAFMM